MSIVLYDKNIYLVSMQKNTMTIHSDYFIRFFSRHESWVIAQHIIVNIKARERSLLLLRIFQKIGKTMAEKQISSLQNLNRTERAFIAEDTLQKLNDGGYNPSKRSRIDFAEDVQFSINNSILYTEDESIGNKKIIITAAAATTTTDNLSDPQIEFRNCTTLQAAYDLVVEQGEQNVGVLNFASAKNPGGGFRKGANAQEESLAKSSSLYLCLTKEEFLDSFYGYHRRGKDALYSHRMIYSPRVTIFKV